MLSAKAVIQAAGVLLPSLRSKLTQLSGVELPCCTAAATFRLMLISSLLRSTDSKANSTKLRMRYSRMGGR